MASLRDPRTAPPGRSVWDEIPEDTFRHNLVVLEERTNAVPVDPAIFPISDWVPPPSPPPVVSVTSDHAKAQRQERNEYVLPLEVEQQVADDFARIVAVDEGAQSVAAVCLEQRRDQDGLSGLTLRFAALDLNVNSGVGTALGNVSRILCRAAGAAAAAVSRSPHGVESDGSSEEDLIEEMQAEVVALHHTRILARMRSSKWEKPKYLARSHKKPLWKDFANLTHRIGHLYARSEKALMRRALERVAGIAAVYERFEDVPLGEDFEGLMDLVSESWEFSKGDVVLDVVRRLEVGVVRGPPTPQVASAIKCLRQVQKIGGYRRICQFLVRTAREYPALFGRGLSVECLMPYRSVATEVGYEAWAKSCHVHAEVQLVVHYDSMRSQNGHGSEEAEMFLRPRCIGISKWLCYLCFLFLKSHGQFFPSKTHGRLYDQWTVPDLAVYDDFVLQEYQRVIAEINGAVVAQAKNEPELWRIEPMTSVEHSFCESIENENRSTELGCA